jgi:hypothetical protein
MLAIAARVKALSTVDDLALGIVDRLVREDPALEDHSKAVREMVKTAVVNILFGISQVLITRPDSKPHPTPGQAQDTRGVRALLQPSKERGYEYQVCPPGVIFEEKNNIPYDKAVQMVLESFRRFSPQFEKNAKLIIDKNHVHSKPTKGKRSGAFCAAPNTQVAPYVLLTYKGNPRSVSTLAHE